MAHVLILEDDTVFAELLVLDLQASGHTAEIVDSGFQALRMLEQRRYDLLIADIYIWKDGHASSDGGMLLIGRMRALRVTHPTDTRAGIPMLAISGALGRPGQNNILRMARAIGADAALAKPFAPEELEEVMARLLAEGPANPLTRAYSD